MASASVYPGHAYFSITPQAMRAPEFPAGSVVKNGVWTVCKCGVWVQQRRLAGPVCAHCEHEQVSSVRPFWIIFSMMLGSRIEMRTRAGESRTFTFADVVDVDAVHAGRQLRHLDVNPN